MSDDPLTDPDFKAFAAHVHAHLIPMMMDVDSVVSLVPKGEADVKYAVELGLAIMLDKPLMLAVPKGIKVPEHLARVADGIVYVDFSDPEATGIAQAKIAAMIDEHDEGRHETHKLRLNSHDAQQLSRMLFDARELIEMFGEAMSSRGITYSEWLDRVVKEIDDFRAAQGWSPNGFGGESGAD